MLLNFFLNFRILMAQNVMLIVGTLTVAMVNAMVKFWLCQSKTPGYEPFCLIYDQIWCIYCKHGYHKVLAIGSSFLVNYLDFGWSMAKFSLRYAALCVRMTD